MKFANAYYTFFYRTDFSYPLFHGDKQIDKYPLEVLEKLVVYDKEDQNKVSKIEYVCWFSIQKFEFLNYSNHQEFYFEPYHVNTTPDDKYMILTDIESFMYEERMTNIPLRKVPYRNLFLGGIQPLRCEHIRHKVNHVLLSFKYIPQQK